MVRCQIPVISFRVLMSIASTLPSNPHFPHLPHLLAYEERTHWAFYF